MASDAGDAKPVVGMCVELTQCIFMGEDIYWHVVCFHAVMATVTTVRDRKRAWHSVRPRTGACYCPSSMLVRGQADHHFGQIRSRMTGSLQNTRSHMIRALRPSVGRHCKRSVWHVDCVSKQRRVPAVLLSHEVVCDLAMDL